ncbi:NAD-dependent epimerase/dehydratase family protein [Marinobacter sp. LN3S78]|uniref:NAD-dependent epimerase/dehydratase family protein n=1 Tax=Marinobacter sp. LN3S78 TaxID=3382300 RepID=UPI00387B6BB6
MVQRTKVLLTGANGFIGRFMLNAIICDSRFEVIVACRGSFEISEGEDVKVCTVGNIDGNTDWSEALFGVDVIVHLAGIAHGKSGRSSNPDIFREVNVRGTEQLAKQALEAGVRHFVFLSSIGVNGASSCDPFSVEDVPAPQDLYAESKFEAENCLKFLCRGTAMSFTIVRPPLVYGPKAPGSFGFLNSVVSKGVPLPLKNISNNRSFISVWNLVDFLKQCLLNNDSRGGVFIVSDGEDVSTSEFLAMIGEMSGQSVRLFYFPRFLLMIGSIVIGKKGMYNKLFDSLTVDDEYARKELNWRPPYTLRESLRMCYQNEPFI